MTTRRLLPTLVLSGLALGFCGAVLATSPTTSDSGSRPQARQKFVALLTSGQTKKPKPANTAHAHNLRAFGRTALTTITVGP